MGKGFVPMKVVTYGLSPFHQKITTGLWKNLPSKIHHKVSKNWIGATLLLGPLVGLYTYVQNYQEKEKLSHRYSEHAIAYWMVSNFVALVIINHQII